MKMSDFVFIGKYYIHKRFIVYISNIEYGDCKNFPNKHYYFSICIEEEIIKKYKLDINSVTFFHYGIEEDAERDLQATIGD
jgi:hypothetical protein